MADLLDRLRTALGDRYRIERELGRGGMAIVYLARDRKLERDVALKVLKPDLAAALGSERFLREIEIAAKLAHPHILPVYDSGRATTTDTASASTGSSEFLYYTMPYLSGESLRDRLRHEKQLPVEDALQITTEVADALGFAHEQGIIHRDIKPENVLFQGGHAVVADFGIARAVTAAGGEQLTETGLVVGTPAYMSPEQGSGSGELDGRSDLYSLACVLYEMLSGETPFTGPTAMAILAKKMSEPAPRVSVVRETVPAVVEAALTRTLARNPVDRYATASEFTAALRGEVVAHPKPARPSRRVPWPALAAAAVVLGIAGVTVARFVDSDAETPPEATLIAVAPFVPSTPDTALTRLGRDLAVLVTANVGGVGDIRAVDAMTVLSQLQGGEAYDRREAAAMARRLGAGRVVHGSLIRLGSEVRLDFGVFTSDSLAEITRASVTAPTPDLVALSDSASWRIVRALSRTGAVRGLVGLTTSSLPALRAYLDGEQATAEGRYDDAVAAFGESVQHDSTFWEAYFAAGRANMFANHDSPGVFRWLMEHFYEMPTTIQECWKADWPWNPWRDPGEGDPPETLTYYIAHYASAVEQHPECPNVWWEYADQMVHHGSQVGYSKADKQAALEAAIQRFPQVSWLWGHLLWVTEGRDSAAVGRALEALARISADPAVWQRLLDRTYRTGVIDTALADSAAQSMLEDNRPKFSYPTEYGFPREAIALARRALSSAPPHEASYLLRVMAFAWAARGEWDSALAVEDRLTARAADGAELEAYGLATVGAWLGALPSSAARERRGAAAAILRESAGLDSAEVWWLDGLLAVTEEDEQGLTTALSRLRQMDETTRRATETSLRALQLERAGNTAEAIRLLTEREWSDTDRDFGNHDYSGHPFVRPVNRLLLARWLLASADTANTVRMLAYQDVHPEYEGRGQVAATLAPIAHLEWGRIEEARGHADVARKHYEQVLQRYDMPVPALRYVVTEAEAGIGRIAMRR